MRRRHCILHRVSLQQLFVAPHATPFTANVSPMPLLRFGRPWSASLYVASAVLLASCASTDGVVSPKSGVPSRPLGIAVGVGGVNVVISQVYGGGGNSGATLKNDFIELYNAGASSVDITGWSVQYASATGTSWQTTNLTGSIAPGKYFLVQEAAGANAAAAALPTPDASGAIPMSATAGKVALVNVTTALSVVCPTGATIVDFVGFGPTANCSETSPTAATANATAALRKNNGATDTDNNNLDFTIGAPNPRNSASAGNCGAPGALASLTVTPANSSVAVGSTPTFTAAGSDANGCPVAASVAWASTTVATATINAASGLASAIAAGQTTISATSGAIVGATLLTVTATANPIVAVAVSPLSPSVSAGGTAQLSAAATDANGTAVSTTFVWSTSNSAFATVNSAGLVTGVAQGGPVTITATAPNAVSGAVAFSVSAAAAITSITLSASTSSLPPGFQGQLFPTARGGSTVVGATFTFLSLDPAIATVATVDNTGIFTAVAASASDPRIQVTAIPTGGGTPFVTVLTPFTVETPITAPTSIYGANDEFGRPTPAGASPTDFLIARAQYVLSYNQTRGTPNWVSYEIDSRHMVSGADRCNCFSADPMLPLGAQLLTSDYTNGGFDRGHMTRSFDRTNANVDNATTFYLTNIVPQQADLNQGVWANFENALGDSAKIGGRTVYIITGPLYAAGATPRFLKSLNKVQIPDSTWKVAFIGPYTTGNPFTRANINSWDDLANTTVLAVNMPNVAGIRNVPWQTYLTTVDKIEAATGVDVLSLLQTAYQTAVEAGDRPPVPSFTGGATGTEGTAVSFNASASTDPDLAVSGFGEALTYSWNFGDGTTSTLASPTKTFADNGAYNVLLTVTDKFGWPRTLARTTTIGNIAPVPNFVARTATTVRVGESVTFGASGTDIGVKDAPWTFTYDWADGTTYAGTVTVLPAASRPLLRAKSWSTPGTYVVTLSIRDKDGSIGSASITITVTP